MSELGGDMPRHKMIDELEEEHTEDLMDEHNVDAEPMADVGPEVAANIDSTPVPEFERWNDCYYFWNFYGNPGTHYHIIDGRLEVVPDSWHLPPIRTVVTPTKEQHDAMLAAS